MVSLNELFTTVIPPSLFHLQNMVDLKILLPAFEITYFRMETTEELELVGIAGYARDLTKTTSIRL